ncbi:chemotaxis protein CheD [Tabrizicola sp. TH137]|uniref:chemotaxis protein CheD n=1 Tax=Tabrizicola sp. TH137 TaxID=2067452 RepID=UPI000C7C6779|nr:chemotaxis protein CheD [Tabrizicola sp. TH137]PLL10865.1 chemotaxis protein CheD [Tabrizicola sp. TH137]
MRLIALMQGEHRVTSDADEVISTVLGSCIAACLWDARAGIGGMNHFLLPDGPAHDGASLRYGLHAMELLINALLRQGAERSALRAKLFGGAHLQPHLPDIGHRNLTFAQEFLRREGIPCIGGSVGGDRGRRIRFWPVDGRAQQFLLPPTAVQEGPAPAAPRSGEVVLF